MFSFVSRGETMFCRFEFIYPTDSGHAGQQEELESDKSVEEDGILECVYPIIQLFIPKSDDGPPLVIMPMDAEKVSMEEYTPNSVIYDTVSAPKI